MNRLSYGLAAVAVGLIGALAVACSGTGDAPEPTASAPTAAPTEAATVAPVPTEAPAPTATTEPPTPEPTATAAPAPTRDYDSTENMFRLFSGRDHSPDDTLAAIMLATDNNDKSMVP